MDDDFLDELRLPATPGSRHALMVASLLHLMSHYTVNSAAGQARDGGPCVRLASVIERHLHALARLPDADPVLRATCEQLSAQWAALVDSGLPAPVPKRPLLARILRPVARKTEAGAAPAFVG
ncbi:hypothetical protein [uncultured Massilia sp.]|uniref:hypothetical protein n=1 Tax=uncultured Massilia sp. TaxID=169973 RepID=UPI0025D1E2F8|nr:hypothetical protein [uncultured Massilia sp.]